MLVMPSVVSTAHNRSPGVGVAVIVWCTAAGSASAIQYPPSMLRHACWRSCIFSSSAGAVSAAGSGDAPEGVSTRSLSEA